MGEDTTLHVDGRAVASKLVESLLVVYNQENHRKDIESDPLLGKIPAVESGGLVLQVDQQQVLSVSAISPLSIPFALKEIVPPIAAAAAQAKG